MKMIFWVGILALFSGYSNASVGVAKDILISKVDISSGGARVYFLAMDNTVFYSGSSECEDGFLVALNGSSTSKRLFSIILAGKTFNGMVDMAFDDSTCAITGITLKYGQSSKGEWII